jgi:glycerol-1-phosphate dehydrogenase [NAD(P)+]
MRNVDAMLVGTGALERAAPELARAAVLTMPQPWEALRTAVAAEPEHVVMLDSVEETVLDALVDELRGVPAVAGVGGGMAVDAAKYVAWKLGAVCISVPTVISTTAFANSMVAIRRNGQVAYVGDGEARADLLVVDYEVVATAPRLLNVAGAADLLAVHTACVDWRIASESGIDEHPFDAGVVEQSEDLVRMLVHRTDIVTRMDGRAVKLLVDLSLEAVEIEALHPRMGEGSEHFLVYLLERLTRRSSPHGMLVGLALDVVSALQDDGSHDLLCRTMDAVGLPYAPRDLELSSGLVRTALEQLPRYVREQDYWYSVVDAKGVPPAFVDATLARLAF